MEWQDALEGYWLSRRRDFSSNTIVEYSLTFSRFESFIGRKQVENITSQDIDAFLNHVEKQFGLSQKSLYNIWIGLSSFFTWAETELALPHPIRGHIKAPQYRRKPVRPYTRNEITAMLHEVSHGAQWTTKTGKRVRSKRPTALRDEAIFMVLLDTGIRASELCDLKVEDYYRRHHRLVVERGKGDKERDLYLGDTAAKALWRYLAERPGAAPDESLFVASGKNRMRPDNLLNMVKATANRSGVPRATVHRFRHTFAIEFLRNGGNVLELKRLLGHESMTTIQIYVELAQVDLENAIRRASPADNWKL